MALYEPIDEAALLHALVRPDQVWTGLRVVAETGSTNADLVAGAPTGTPSGSVLIADYQSAGRGRRERAWTAPPGTGVAVSVLLHPPDVAPARWGWLPLLAGLAVSEGLRRYPGVPAVLKWPNDVLIGDSKVAGILVERVDTSSGPAVVVGFGINVHLSMAQLPVPSATSLALRAAESSERGPLNRTEVIRCCLESLGEFYLGWESGTADNQLATSYRDRCATIGRQVRVELADGRSIEGSATSVDGAGRLVVRTSGQLEVISAGDVIHLRGV